MPELGDRKPSALMDDMLGLLEDHTACFLFEYILFKKMPEDIRVVLANEDFTNPRLLAQRADALWLARTPFAAQPVLGIRRKNVPRRAPYRAIANEKDSSLCFYHKRFGDKARDCTPPCSYQGNDHAGRPL